MLWKSQDLFENVGHFYLRYNFSCCHGDRIITSFITKDIPLATNTILFIIKELSALYLSRAQENSVIAAFLEYNPGYTVRLNLL